MTLFWWWVAVKDVKVKGKTALIDVDRGYMPFNAVSSGWQFTALMTWNVQIFSRQSLNPSFYFSSYMDFTLQWSLTEFYSLLTNYKVTWIWLLLSFCALRWHYLTYGCSNEYVCVFVCSYVTVFTVGEEHAATWRKTNLESHVLTVRPQLWNWTLSIDLEQRSRDSDRCSKSLHPWTQQSSANLQLQNQAETTDMCTHLNIVCMLILHTVYTQVYHIS